MTDQEDLQLLKKVGGNKYELILGVESKTDFFYENLLINIQTTKMHTFVTMKSLTKIRWLKTILGTIDCCVVQHDYLLNSNLWAILGCLFTTNMYSYLHNMSLWRFSGGWEDN